MGELNHDSVENTHIETEGGAVCRGSVTVSSGGTVIGRDAYYGYTAEQVRLLIAARE